MRNEGLRAKPPLGPACRAEISCAKCCRKLVDSVLVRIRAREIGLRPFQPPQQVTPGRRDLLSPTGIG